MSNQIKSPGIGTAAAAPAEPSLSSTLNKRRGSSSFSDTKPWCPCRDCRPAWMSLQQAIKHSNWLGQVRAYGEQGAIERRRRDLARLAVLKEAK